MSLAMGYKSLMMELGFYKNPFRYDYHLFLGLATDGAWFKNVWELLHNFGVTASFNSNFQLHPIWVGDSSLMSEFACHYSGSDLILLNAFQLHKVMYCSM
jgi:hypothetical protein